MKKSLLFILFMLNLSLGFSQSIVSISPDSAYQGQTLNVKISGQGTSFKQGSTTIVVWFSQGSNTIYSIANLAINNKKLFAKFSIPSNANIGLWDINVMDVNGKKAVLSKGFTVYAKGSNLKQSNTNKITGSGLIFSPGSASPGQTLNVKIVHNSSVYGFTNDSTINIYLFDSNFFLIAYYSVNVITIVNDSTLISHIQIPLNIGLGNISLGVEEIPFGNNPSYVSFALFSIVSSNITQVNPSSACLGQTLDVTISGQGTSFTQGTNTISSWFSQGSNTINANTITVLTDSTISANFSIPSNANAGLWDVNIIDGQSQQYLISSGFTITNSCDVWPGDANYDYTANNYDLLNIGIAYGASGNVRVSASNTWIAQACTDWGTSFSNGTDYKHADCNGDGTIDDDDTLAINLNYGLMHNKTSFTTNATASDPDLYLELANDTANTSDTLKILIKLGSLSVPVNNVYGLAFSINYNNKLIDSVSTKVDFSNSWIGNKTNALSLSKNFHSKGRIDLAFTRKDQQNVSGYGSIGELDVIVEDNIAGKDMIYKMLNFTLSEVSLISNNETEIPVNLVNDSIIIQGVVTGIVEETIQDKVKLYPNPTNNFLTLELPSMEVYEISIFNSIGLLVYSSKHFSQTTKQNIDLNQLPAGVYMLEVKNKNGEKALKKLVKF